MGHKAVACFKRKNDERDKENRGTRKQNNFKDDDVEDGGSAGFSHGCALVATVSNECTNYVNYTSVDISNYFLIDSGASKHMTYRREWFSEFRPSSGETVKLGNEGICNVEGIGKIFIERYVNGKWQPDYLENVLYVPKMKRNLFAVGSCTVKGYKVTFDDKQVYIENKITGQIIGEGVRQENGLYRMFFKICVKPTNEVSVASTDISIWHERMAHVNKDVIYKMNQKGLLGDVKVLKQKDFFCEPCALGKSRRLPFNKVKNNDVSWKPGEFFHSDICGPMPVQSLGGKRYFALFKDASTGYTYVYFLKYKNDIFQIFKEFERAINNKFEKPIKILRIDNGREYICKNLIQYTKNYGIKLERAAPYTPQQNGISERANRTVMEAARTLMISSGIPSFLWAEAVNTAVYIQNRLINKRSPDITPFQSWTGKKPDFNNFKIFGCQAYKHIPDQFRKKLDDKLDDKIR